MKYNFQNDVEREEEKTTFLPSEVIFSIDSVLNSSSGLLFVKIRAESGRIFSKNPGKIRAKIRAKLNFVILSSFYDLGHVQTGILPFGEQLHNALNVH